jgi:uncharacterized protein (TIGR00369 family)
VATIQDTLEQWLRGEATPPPIAQLIGFKLIDIQPGQTTVEFQAGPQHANPMGTLHGGILCDIADAAMGMAFFTLLDEGQSFTTLELKINFLKPVWNARLTAIGRIVKAGRMVGLAECDVTDEGGSLVARASSTCLRLSGDAAEGR